MYRCGMCGVCSKPGQTRRTHVVYRLDNGHRQIDREIPVCPGCGDRLARSAPAQGPDELSTVAPIASGRLVRTVRPK